MKRVGVVKTLDDIAVSKRPTEGFRGLVDAGLSEYLLEYLVLQYPDRFQPRAVERAKERLAEHNLPLATAV